MKPERIDKITNLLDSLSLRGKWEIFQQLDEKGSFNGQFNIRGIGGGLVAGDIVGILESADATFMAQSPQIVRELLEEIKKQQDWDLGWESPTKENLDEYTSLVNQGKWGHKQQHKARAAIMTLITEVLRLRGKTYSLPASNMPNHCKTCGQYDANQCGGMG